MNDYGEIWDKGSPDGVFSHIQAGQQADGVVIGDFGWACMDFAEVLGVEHLIGLSGFANAEAYMDWLRQACGFDLADWEACSIEVNQCWLYSSIHNQSTITAGTISERSIVPGNAVMQS